MTLGRQIRQCRTNEQSKKEPVRTGITCPWQRNRPGLCERARQRLGETLSIAGNCTAWEKLDHERKNSFHLPLCKVSSACG